MRSHKKTQKIHIHKNNPKYNKQRRYTSIKKMKHNLKKYNEKLDMLLNGKYMSGKEQMAEINMTQAQKSAIYMALLHLVLIGTDNSIKMAKDYSKKAGMDYSNLVKDSKKAKPSRKVGSMRIISKYKKKPSDLRKKADTIKKKLQQNKKYYEQPQIGDSEIGIGLGLGILDAII